MKKSFLFFKILLLSLILLVNSNASIQNSIIANVEGELISSYELKNKIKTILFLSNQEMSQENINQIKNQAMKSLIEYKLKKIEIEKFKVSITNIKLNKYVENFATKFDTNVKGLKSIFKENDLDFDIYLNEIKTDLAWQQFVYNFYRKKISIDEKDIDNELKEILNSQNNIEQYNLAEIEIFSENSSTDRKNIDEVMSQINEIGFKNAAKKFSTSSSSIDGGVLGWINSKSMSDKILKIVKNMKIQDISKPIYQANSILLLKLLDKKKTIIDNENVGQIRKNIISRKTNDQLNLFSNSYLSKLRNNSFIQIK